ncbi:MAG: hypothetical protein HGA45_17890, partial [Chloroflexales bacterium]|nr:hypothetical protein [Chloroflexales bacterium]
MDANGTHFHLLQGCADWARCADGKGRALGPGLCEPSRGQQPDALAWDDERYELTLRPKIFRFTAAPRDVAPTLERRRGAGRDRFGSWYWIDEGRQAILVNSAGTGRTSHFWAAGDGERCAEPPPAAGAFQPRELPAPAAPLRLSGLAVTEDHYLVVGTLEPAGLLIFDLHAGGPPRRLLWPAEVPFVPFDMAPAPGGGVWVLDRDNRRFWGLDRLFGVLRDDQAQAVLAPARRDDFQPLGDESPPAGQERGRRAGRFPTGITLDDASPVAALDPVAIEALPDGTVLILDNGAATPSEAFAFIYRHRFGRQLGAASTSVLLGVVDDESQGRFQLTGHDMAYVPATSTAPARLYIVVADGNQVFAFSLGLEDDGLTLKPVEEYLPMRLFGGKGLVTAGDRAYYDFADTWVPLVAQRRPRYEQAATLVSPPLDGRQPGCVWHRLLLDACLQPETAVLVWSRAADELADLADASWQAEPRLYLRGGGSELPFAPRREGSGNGTWELLFQQARGRYMQIRLELSGNGRTTPRLRAARAYYPRFSYPARYLPAVYREDAQSASFLERFMANIEGLATALEDKIAAVQMLFDLRSAPPESLEWLASWFGVALDPAWDERRRRLFISHAMEFFAWRGTARGLLMALRLVLDECADETIFAEGQGPGAGSIRIIEAYRARRTPRLLLGDPTVPASPLRSAAGGRWLPAMGRDELHRRWRDELAQRFDSPPSSPESQDFPLLAPADTQLAEVWSAFATATLGFVPSASADEPGRWHAFLARRYPDGEDLKKVYQTERATEVPLPTDLPAGGERQRDWADFAQSAAPASEWARWRGMLSRRYGRISALNTVYGTRWSGFELAPLPVALPADGGPLRDWYQFETVVRPMYAAAHRFSVLLPVPRTDTITSELYQQR